MAAPSLPRALLLDECTPSWLADAQALGCVAIVPRQGWLTAEVIAQAHGHGLKVLTYTVNTVARADELWLAGLDGLITDEVDLFRPQASAFSNLP